jgi:arabinofuranosyltransferase
MMPFMEASAKPSPQLFLILMAIVAVGIGLSFGVCTQDDAFISFRYAENLVAGNGLVFNVDERVEGFTNLSWTLLFAGLMAVGAEPVMASVILGWIGVAALVLVTGQLAHRCLGPMGAVMAAAFVATDSQMVLEGVEGLETVFYAVLVTAGISSSLKDGGGRATSAWFAAASLTRPEGVLLWGATHLALLVRDWDFTARIRCALSGAWPLVLTLMALTAWRVFYYGDWLPNTFYAKTGGMAAARGLEYLMAHAVSHPILWLAAVCSCGLASRQVRSLGAIVAVVFAYIVWVGGDFKPTGRFVIPVLPVLAVMAGCTLEWLLGKPALRRWMLPLAFMVFGWARWDQYLQAGSWAEERHANLQARQLVGDWIAQNTPQATVLAVHSAGVVPYFSGRRTIDMWGLTNREVARTEVGTMGTGMAGHERSAPEYVFALKPDVYLPEDKLFTLRPWKLEPEAGVSKTFAEHYRVANIPIEGRWLNMWVRTDGLLRGLQGAEGAIEQ